MPSTYEKIATTTLGSATNTVTFNSISGSYTDLILVINGTLTGSAVKYINFNGDSAANYSITTLIGTGTSAVSSRYGEPYLDVYNSAANPFMNVVKIMNYSNTTTYKTFFARQDAPSTTIEQIVGLWRSTSAITSLSIYTTSNQFSTGSTFTIYGIKAA
jgi:hypothetical protein